VSLRVRLTRRHEGRWFSTRGVSGTRSRARACGSRRRRAAITALRLDPHCQGCDAERSGSLSGGRLNLENGAVLELSGPLKSADMYRVSEVHPGNRIAACYGPLTTYADAARRARHGVGPAQRSILRHARRDMGFDFSAISASTSHLRQPQPSRGRLLSKLELETIDHASLHHHATSHRRVAFRAHVPVCGHRFFRRVAWIIKAVRRTETTVQGGVRNVEGRLSGTTRRSTTRVEDDVP